MSIAIRLAETEADRQAVYRFRYLIYVEEMGKQIPHADHSRLALQDECDKGAVLLIAESGDEIVATCRIVFGIENEVPKEWFEKFSLEKFSPYVKTDFCFVSRLMAARRFRNFAAVSEIVKAAYRIGREKQVKFAFMHCKPELVEFYQGQGYRKYAQPFEDADVGLQVPLVLVVEDEDHLRVVRSLFHAEAVKWSNPPTEASWFNTNFGDYEQ